MGGSGWDRAPPGPGNNQFFDDLMGLPPYCVQFSDQKFRKLLFFPVVNAIQQTKNGPWHIKIAVAEPLMKNYYPFHFPPTLKSDIQNGVRQELNLYQCQRICLL